MWGTKRHQSGPESVGDERRPFSSAANRLAPPATFGEPASVERRTSGRRGSVNGPTRRRLAPLITITSLVALAGAGIVHTVGLEPVGRSGGAAGAPDRDPLTNALRDSVMFQCNEVGRRTSRYSPRQDALEDHLREAIAGAGLRLVEHDYTVGSISGRNFIGVLPGRGPGAVLVGTHYDSHGKSPCANATASAVAALAGVARELRGGAFERTILFGFFDNGERPNHGGPTAGAAAWLEAFSTDEGQAAVLPNGGELELALLLSSFGSWSDVAGSHRASFPWNLAVPDVADWVGIFGGLGERRATADLLASWGRNTDLPARGFALPSWAPGVPPGDEGPFRRASIPALVISDTGAQRAPEVRTSEDGPYFLNYGEMARRVRALATVVAEQADR